MFIVLRPISGDPVLTSHGEVISRHRDYKAAQKKLNAVDPHGKWGTTIIETNQGRAGDIIPIVVSKPMYMVALGL